MRVPPFCGLELILVTSVALAKITGNQILLGIFFYTHDLAFPDERVMHGVATALRFSFPEVKREHMEEAL